MTSEEAENMENTNRNRTTYLDTRNEINHEIVRFVKEDKRQTRKVAT